MLSKKIYIRALLTITAIVFSYFLSQLIKESAFKNYIYTIQPVYYTYMHTIEKKLELVSSDYNYENIEKQIQLDELSKTSILLLNDQNQIIAHFNKTALLINANRFIDENQKQIFSPTTYLNYTYKQDDSYYQVFIKKTKIKNNDFSIILILSLSEYIYMSYKIQFMFFIFILSFFVMSNFLVKSIVKFKKSQTDFDKQIKKELNLFQDLVNSSPHSLLILTDEKGIIESVSESIDQLLYLNSDELIGKNISKIIPDFSGIDIIFNILSKSEEELNIYCKNNMVRTVYITLVPYYGVNDQLQKLLFIMNDLSEIKQKNVQLARELNKTRTYTKIAQLITTSSDPKIVIQTIIEETRQLFDYDHGTLFLVKDDLLAPFYTNNPSLVNKLDQIRLQVGQGLTGLVAKTQKGMIINNALNSPIPSSIPGTTDVDECLISHPLISKNKLLGVITFSRIGNAPFTEDDLKILETLSVQAASVLDNSILINKLAESERKYYSLINQSALSIIILQEKRIAFCNNRFMELLKYDSETINNSDIVNFINLKDKSIFASQLTSYLLEGKCEDFEISLKTSTNETIVMSFSLSSISWDNQSSIMVTATDVTEKIELNKQLLQTQKLESVGALASGIAHDFKNILAGIIGASDMLLLKLGDDSPVLNFARIIKSSADRGTRLAQRLLGFTRKEDNDRYSFDLNEILNEIIEIASYTFEKNIDIITTLVKKPLQFDGDPVKIQQCILNLCVNARDAMPKGGTLVITSELIDNRQEIIEDWAEAEKRSYIKLKISDTGTGIPKEILNKIFEPFFTTKEKGKGTGLGLSTTRSIIAEFKGNIIVDSEMNKGTSFTIYLPYSQTAIIHTVPEATNKPINKHTILIVDDEEFVLEVAKELLQELGNEVIIASSGKEALNLLNLNPHIDLAILDRMMPKMDGIQLFKEIRTINPELNVVIASGFIQETEIEELQKQGLYDYINKPYRMDDLQRILRF